MGPTRGGGVLVLLVEMLVKDQPDYWCVIIERVERRPGALFTLAFP